ncbi:hypothetical protein KP509_25G046900 [Ceratopteris richardii]|uniref:Uncharacterized protein n=1 Tax=Ceratopteris richardii TaxID=49495 RepID=A0A8T2RSK6_CERRI|nr:hypothetical protein KP509_25G046900 [Ceratopteris richardii]
MRALGNLTRVVNFSTEDTSIHVTTVNCTNPLGKGTLLERVVQALVSCVTTGNVKVQWNVCHALGNLFLNKSIPIHAMPWSTSVYSIMLLLLRDSKNFKIQIQAASTLAVLDKRRDYGQSFSDIVQALVLSQESLNSSELADPSTYKYMVALNEQMHVCMY